jgi:hypothetical protein
VRQALQWEERLASSGAASRNVPQNGR